MTEYGETIAVRFPPELESQLEDFAKRQMTSASQVIRIAVKEYLDSKTQPAPSAKGTKAGK